MGRAKEAGISDEADRLFQALAEAILREGITLARARYILARKALKLACRRSNSPADIQRSLCMSRSMYYRLIEELGIPE